MKESKNTMPSPNPIQVRGEGKKTNSKTLRDCSKNKKNKTENPITRAWNQIKQNPSGSRSGRRCGWRRQGIWERDGRRNREEAGGQTGDPSGLQAVEQPWTLLLAPYLHPMGELRQERSPHPHSPLLSLLLLSDNGRGSGRMAEGRGGDNKAGGVGVEAQL